MSSGDRSGGPPARRRRSSTTCSPWPIGRPQRPAAAARRAAATPHPGRHQDEHDRLRHRDGPGVGAPHRRRGYWPPGPTTASSARRAPPSRARSRRPLDHRPARRHDQLPLRHPRLRGFDRGRGRRRDGRRRGPRCRPRRGVHRGPRAGAPAATASRSLRPAQPTGPVAGRHRFQLRQRVAAPSGRGARAGPAPRSATSGASGRPRSTSAWSPAAGPTPTTSGGSTRGTGPRAGSSPRRPGGGRAALDGDPDLPGVAVRRPRRACSTSSRRWLEDAIAEVAAVMTTRSADCHRIASGGPTNSAQSPVQAGVRGDPAP